MGMRLPIWDPVLGHQRRPACANETTRCASDGLWKVWWRRGGSNSRPSHCERDALPAELRPHKAAKYSELRLGRKLSGLARD